MFVILVDCEHVGLVGVSGHRSLQLANFHLLSYQCHFAKWQFAGQ